ncbi:ferredoxin [uncultured Roseobacter sp.]|uniref:ferredoxin n=1 Tax=uncultured Roseobacter sp. TaxID=114847 RepID=UPI00261D98E9|nr:ferredoxin [uncultured Roseobacter sp.]
MILDELSDAARAKGLFVMGVCRPDTSEHGASIALLGADAEFWQVFEQAPEYTKGVADPLDTWSKRVIGGLADRFDALGTSFPSDGPPYLPFIAWALATKQFFQSPTGMMIHNRAGLMISIRGAVHFATDIGAPPAVTNPCLSCEEQPCTKSCPVGALSSDAPYDVSACKAFLATPAGTDCMEQGCKARRACPVSARFDRAPQQSAFHMAAFTGG